jgi:hypothetical protein
VWGKERKGAKGGYKKFYLAEPKGLVTRSAAKHSTGTTIAPNNRIRQRIVHTRELYPGHRPEWAGHVLKA